MPDLDHLVIALSALARATSDHTSAGGATAPSLVGIGWASVDGERTTRESPGIAFTAGPDEESLGARSWTGRVGSVELAILEPSTEGRLAAALARRGEGLAVLYLENGEVVGARRGTALGRPGRLLPHGRPWGPFIVIVDPS